MNRKAILGFLLPAVLFITLCVCVPTQHAEQTLEPVIRQVDHILVATEDPAPLFDFFAGTLQLPVAWPLADYRGFSSGGIGAGNVNIEVMRSLKQEVASSGKSVKARFAGFAFEPALLAQSLPQLKARGIPYKSPEPYRSTLPDGSEG